MRLRATRLTAIATAVRRLFNPASLFATGAPGLWYDLSLTDGTLFQDAAGTTPVTAVEQPVGLVLDKSKGLVLGPELVTNGDFSGGSTGWSNTGAASFTVTEGVATVILGGAGGTAVAFQSIGASAGKVYSVIYTITALSGGTVDFRIGGTFGASRTLPGTYKEIIRTSGATVNAGVALTAAGAASASIDNISVRELPGNHAFQTTSANRPVLSARYNLLTKTEQLDDAAWAKLNATVTSNAAVAPDGTTTATLVECALGMNARVSQVAAGVGGVPYVATIFAKGTVGQTVSFYVDSIGGTYGAWNFSPTVFTGSWQVFSVAFTSNAGNTGFNFGVRANIADTARNFYIWHPDLRVANDGVNLPPYQRVNTATDYDTVGFPLYLLFNGSTQFLQTNSIDFSSTDKVLVAAGVRKLSDAALGMVAELSASSTANVGTFAAFAPRVSGDYGFRSFGTGQQDATSTAVFAAPITNILTGIGDISGDRATLRINGAQVAQSTADQGTGNYGNHPLYIGARAGTALFFSGRLYSLIIAGIKPTDAQLLGVETYINSLTKAF